MKQNHVVDLIDVNAENVEQTGFFCFMSKKKSEGYQRKLRWLKDRFAEGLRLKMLPLPERGFIEYIPGEHAWRSVYADGYLLIHCLWVVGKSKGQGFAAKLLEACLTDAKQMKLKGVALITSEHVWLTGRRLFTKNGFECVDTAPPSFSLMVKKFGRHSSPRFTGDWEPAPARRTGTGGPIS
jgi:GNAT superfamily N-acetyltransferase